MEEDEFNDRWPKISMKKTSTGYLLHLWLVGYDRSYKYTSFKKEASLTTVTRLLIFIILIAQ
jgi:hypothetical protein